MASGSRVNRFQPEQLIETFYGAHGGYYRRIGGSHPDRNWIVILLPALIRDEEAEACVGNPNLI